MLGLEEYYISLLNEAKSPEEIKKILEYQFVQGKGVPQEILNSVFDVDPTKKKSYTRWVLAQWPEYKESIEKSIENGKLKRMFSTFKNRENSGLDLGRMKNFDEAIDMIPDIDPILEKEGDPDAPENDFEIAYTSEDGNWIVARPHTYQADIKLGHGCRWCTAGAYGMDRAEYFYNNYSGLGPLWINFDKTKKEIAPMDQKEYPYKRYQFLFEYNNWRGELKDSSNETVNLSTIDMPADVVEFYGAQNPRYKEIIERVDTQALWEKYLRDRHNMRQLVFDDSDVLEFLPERNSERRLEGVPWYLYASEHEDDPISHIEFDVDNCVEFKCSGMGDYIAVLSDTDGVYHCYIGFPYNWKQYHDVEFFPIRGMQSWNIISIKGFETYVVPNNPNNGMKISTIHRNSKNGGGDASVISAFKNSQIEEAAHSEGASGNYIEFIWSDGAHSLGVKWEAENKMDLVIPHDFPADGEDKFVASEGSGSDSLIVRGRILDYNLFGNNSRVVLYTDKSYECGKKVYIVQYTDGYTFNVYDATERRMLFDEPLKSVDTINIGPEKKGYWIYADKNDKKGIADLESGREICGGFNQLVRRGESSHAVLGLMGEGNEKRVMVMAFSSEGCHRLGTYRSFFNLSNEGYIGVRLLDGKVNILNLETGQLGADGNYIHIGCLSDSSSSDDGMVILETENVSFVLYNYIENQIIASNLKILDNNHRPKKPSKNISQGGWIISFEDGKQNIVKDRRVILPKNVDEIHPVPRGDYYILLDSNKMWFVKLADSDRINLLPTPTGIPCDAFKLDEFGSAGVRFSYKSPNWPGEVFLIQYYVDTMPNSFKVAVIGDGDEEPIEISENNPAYREIYSKFFPVAAAVRENFNRTLKMINDFYKDK